jgi:hypothetical protein
LAAEVTRFCACIRSCLFGTSEHGHRSQLHAHRVLATG